MCYSTGGVPIGSTVGCAKILVARSVVADPGNIVRLGGCNEGVCVSTNGQECIGGCACGQSWGLDAEVMRAHKLKVKFEHRGPCDSIGRVTTYALLSILSTMMLWNCKVNVI